MPPQAPFVAEGAPGPNLQFSFDGVTVGPTKKILILAGVSAELESATPQAASVVVGRVLSNVASRSIDLTAFGMNPGDDASPAGLLHGVKPIPAAAAGTDAMTEDLGALIGAIAGSGIDPTGTAFVCSSREATILKTRIGPKFDYPILSTLGLLPKTVAAFAPSAIASGYQDHPQIETSRSGVVHYDDSNPSEVVAPDGRAAAPTYSAYQSNLISIRVRARAAWACQPGGAQVVQSVNW